MTFLDPNSEDLWDVNPMGWSMMNCLGLGKTQPEVNQIHGFII